MKNKPFLFTYMLLSVLLLHCAVTQLLDKKYSASELCGSGNCHKVLVSENIHVYKIKDQGLIPVYPDNSDESIAMRILGRIIKSNDKMMLPRDFIDVGLYAQYLKNEKIIDTKAYLAFIKSYKTRNGEKNPLFVLNKNLFNISARSSASNYLKQIKMNEIELQSNKFAEVVPDVNKSQKKNETVPETKQNGNGIDSKLFYYFGNTESVRTSEQETKFMAGVQADLNAKIPTSINEDQRLTIISRIKSSIESTFKENNYTKFTTIPVALHPCFIKKILETDISNYKTVNKYPPFIDYKDVKYYLINNPDAQLIVGAFLVKYDGKSVASLNKAFDNIIDSELKNFEIKNIADVSANLKLSINSRFKELVESDYKMRIKLISVSYKNYNELTEL